MAAKTLRKATPTDSVVVRPDIAVAESYISRTIGDQTDLDLADFCRMTTTNLLLEGPTGPGKTTFAMAYAAQAGLPFYAIPSSATADPSSFFGKWIPGQNGTPEWVDGPVAYIVRNGGVLLITEINMMPAPLAAALFGLLDGRREISLLDKGGEVIKAHRPFKFNSLGTVIGQCWCGDVVTDKNGDSKPGPECESRWVLLMADCNPGYLGTRPLNAALRNRFGMRLDWDYNVDVEKQLLRSGPLLDAAMSLRTGARQGMYTVEPSTNALQEFERFAVEFGVPFAIDNLTTLWPPNERPAVKQYMVSVSDGIRASLLGSAPDDWRKMSPAELQEWRKKLRTGDIDPEWGVLGENWFWGDE